MPFVALLDESDRVDLTQVDEGVWTAIYRVSPRRHLTCRQCGWTMRAKRRGDTRFFAHDPHAPECEAATESAEHLRLKALFAQAARAAGWYAEVEERVGENRWADVLAQDPQGDRQVAFEIQLASQTAIETQERTHDYATAGADVVWIVKRSAALGGWKSVEHMVLGPKDKVLGPTARRITVDHKEVVDGEDVVLSRPVWEASARLPTVEDVVAALLSGRAAWTADGATWVPSSELDEFARDLHQFELDLAEVTRRRAERQRIDGELLQQTDRDATSEQRRRERNTEQWLRRQAQLTDQVVEALEAAGQGPCEVIPGDASTGFAAEVFIPPWLPAKPIYVCPVISRVEDTGAVAQRLSGPFSVKAGAV